jgi:predicted CoA-substrate-specific enzyme activase
MGPYTSDLPEVGGPPPRKEGPMSFIWLGVDVGSTTVKLVAVDEAGALLFKRYARANGRPRETLLEAHRSLRSQLGERPVASLGVTGSGGASVAAVLGGMHLNELVAQTRAIGRYHPEAHTVIEIGGQDSKYLSVRWDETTRQMILVDFAMNALCAAGTGSFLDQQAERLGVAIEEEFGRIALASHRAARVAGRCTVFAKSDMIHLQQEGTPLPDILAGLCLALARNFCTVIGKGKDFSAPVLFQGGVAYNKAVVRAFEQVLKLDPGELMVPEQHCYMAALGAAFIAADEARSGRPRPFHGFQALEAAILRRREEESRLEPLTNGRPPSRLLPVLRLESAEPIPTYLGVDVGSISTNLVLIDEEDRVLGRRYLMTSGQPLEAVRRGLRELLQDVGGGVEVRAVGSTGSGRYLTGDFVGADVVRNEITTQARAASAMDPRVDTVFEIGGQDSKYIRIQDGAVVDFAMNKACAAGTGSFLEEQADRLQIDIEEDFAELAFSSGCPSCLGERCTVFMESDLVHHQQRGAAVEDLTAGLAYSIVHNYLNRVVDTRELGNHIHFQGGVAANQSVTAAFEQVTGRAVTVPPHHDVTGAIGAAILAREEMARRPPGRRATRFRGFGVADRSYETSSFECRACPNLCEVKRIEIEGESPIFYGARCDIFEEAGRKQGNGRHLPDLFAERTALLMEGYQEPEPGSASHPRVGIPRSLIFHDLFPYWRTLFAELGIEIVLSGATSPRLIQLARERAAAETCFPVKLAFAHVVDLLDRGVSWLFLPSVLDRENVADGQVHNHYCPYIPAAPGARGTGQATGPPQEETGAGGGGG